MAGKRTDASREEAHMARQAFLFLLAGPLGDDSVGTTEMSELFRIFHTLFYFYEVEVMLFKSVTILRLEKPDR